MYHNKREKFFKCIFNKYIFSICFFCCIFDFYFYTISEIIGGELMFYLLHRFNMSNYRDVFLADTYYLISNKWFNNSVLFENSDDYKAFMLYVIENLLEYKWLFISAYSLLPDHFHFMLKNHISKMKVGIFFFSFFQVSKK